MKKQSGVEYWYTNMINIHFLFTIFNFQDAIFNYYYDMYACACGNFLNKEAYKSGVNTMLKKHLRVESQCCRYIR